MISLAIALDAATRQATPAIIQTVDAGTCDASGASGAPEPSLSGPADCDQSVANTMADPSATLHATDYVETRRHDHHRFRFNPFGIFGHHKRWMQHGHERVSHDPMQGRDVPVTTISREWHSAYNAELKASHSDQPPLPEVSVRVYSFDDTGAQRNVAHVVLPLKDTSTMLTGVWRQYKAGTGDYRLVLEGTVLEIVAKGSQPVARYTKSEVTGFTHKAGVMTPVTKVTVFEAPIVAQGGAHRGYHVANLRYAIETEAVQND